jgi:hypothetical protein
MTAWPSSTEWGGGVRGRPAAVHSDPLPRTNALCLRASSLLPLLPCSLCYILICRPVLPVLFVLSLPPLPTLCLRSPGRGGPRAPPGAAASASPMWRSAPHSRWSGRARWSARRRGGAGKSHAHVVMERRRQTSHRKRRDGRGWCGWLGGGGAGPV